MMATIKITWLYLYPIVVVAQIFCEASQDEIAQIGKLSYIYGYPLVLMDITKKVMTHNLTAPLSAHAPINQFAHATSTPTDTFTDVVRPSIDLLYSVAWLDLSKEPIILTVPDTNGRFYVMPLYDMYTNVFATIITPQPGTGKRYFAITGPQWNKPLPESIQQIKAPDNSVWVIGRTQINGVTDLDTVRALQKEYTLQPLSSWNTPKKTSRALLAPVLPATIDEKPMDQLEHMDAPEFFTYLMRAMAANKAPQTDASILKRMASIGLIPSKNFNFATLSPAVQEGLKQSPAQARILLKQETQSFGRKENSWSITRTNSGHYGTDYLKRAVTAVIALGALPSDVAVYANTTEDINGKKLSGNHQYMLHFKSGQLPPVRAFWSVTIYDEQGFLVKNPLSRYALGDRDNLIFNTDGSLDIYLQTQSPGNNKATNWLPIPQVNFAITMRLYMPQPAVINGRWQLPSVIRQ